MSPSTLPSLTPSGIANLDKLLLSSVASRKVPATWFGLTNGKETFYSNYDGPLDFDNERSAPVDETTILQMWSATKFVTTVASLQLVDRGLFSLDDPSLVEKHLPELGQLKIIKGYTDDGKPIWEEPTNKITLRMLLSHTSGLSYIWNNPNLVRWASETDINYQFLGANTTETCYLYPLVYNPGTSWEYGTGLDWAGIMIMRITGKSLEEHYKEFIFDKAGMMDTTFYPTEEVKKRMLRMTVQDVGEDKPLSCSKDNFASLPFLTREEDPGKIGPVLSGGGGLFSTAKDYLKLLRGVLRSQSGDHVDALLSRKSFLELFTDSLSSGASHENLYRNLQAQSYHGPELFLHEAGEARKLGHSVGLALNKVDSSYGRKAGSGCWDGAARTQYWLDPKTGLAGICMTNVLCPGSNEFVRLYNRFERTVYDGLSSSSKDPDTSHRSTGEAMPDPSMIPVDYRFLFKPLEDVQAGGCNASVWLPKAAERFVEHGAPVAIFYHGGGWIAGSSEQIAHYQVKYFLERGIVVVSFDYRLLPHVTLKEIRADLLDSYRYIQEGRFALDLEHVGSKVKIDGTRCVALGSSAGGSNTIYLAHAIENFNKQADQSTALPVLKAIIPTYPLVQFDVLNDPRSAIDEVGKTNPYVAKSIERVNREMCQTFFAPEKDYIPRITEIFSGTAEGNTDLDRANHRWIWATKNTSLVSFLVGQDQPYPELTAPLDLVSYAFPPTCVVAATADTLIPPIQSRNLTNRVQELGGIALYVECKGMSHLESECLPVSPPWAEGNTYWQDAFLPSLEFAMEHMLATR